MKRTLLAIAILAGLFLTVLTIPANSQVTAKKKRRSLEGHPFARTAAIQACTHRCNTVNKRCVASAEKLKGKTQGMFIAGCADKTRKCRLKCKTNPDHNKDVKEPPLANNDTKKAIAKAPVPPKPTKKVETKKAIAKAPACLDKCKVKDVACREKCSKKKTVAKVTPPPKKRTKPKKVILTSKSLKRIIEQRKKHTTRLESQLVKLKAREAARKARRAKWLAARKAKQLAAKKAAELRRPATKGDIRKLIIVVKKLKLKSKPLCTCPVPKPGKLIEGCTTKKVPPPPAKKPA